MSATQLYRVHLADGGVRRVRVRVEGGSRYVEGDRYPLEVPVAGSSICAAERRAAPVLRPKRGR